MRLTPYGKSTLNAFAAGLFAVMALMIFIDMHPALRFGLLLAAAALTFLVLNFFRDPDRSTPQGDNLVIAPADGKVIAVGEVFEPAFINGQALRVCIFMSPLDVHVNRFPVSGKVGYVERIAGKFTPAFKDKASEDNDLTLIGIERGRHRVLFKQITGAVARRIVAEVAVGQQAVAGERFGMIRFGSRVDVLLPPSATAAVGLNDRTVAGETVIARLPAAG